MAGFWRPPSGGARGQLPPSLRHCAYDVILTHLTCYSRSHAYGVILMHLTCYSRSHAYIIIYSKILTHLTCYSRTQAINKFIHTLKKSHAYSRNLKIENNVLFFYQIDSCIITIGQLTYFTSHGTVS